MKFSALNADSSSSGGSGRPAHESDKEGTFLTSGYFTAIGLSSMKTVADSWTTCV